MYLFEPILTPWLDNRRAAGAMAGVAIAQCVLTRFQLQAWQCPVFHFLGIPCPGCGLTRATILFVRGDWSGALHFHAFAPVLVSILILAVCSSVLPDGSRRRLLTIIESLERQTGISMFVICGLIVYWMARLVVERSAFVRLIHG